MADQGPETAWNNALSLGVGGIARAMGFGKLVSPCTRRDACAACIRKHRPEIIMTQEGLDFQLRNIADDLEEKYLYVGQKRGGPTWLNDETSAIFYERALWDLERTGDYMLSDTPDTPFSAYPGADWPMITTWVLLSGRKARAGQRILVVSTHLDPGNRDVRAKSAKQVIRITGELYSTYACDAAFIAGDFNCAYEEEAYTVFEASGWVDSYKTVHGPENDQAYPKGSFTYHAFKGGQYVPAGAQESDPDHAIDFVFMRPTDVQVTQAAFDKDRYTRYGADPRGIWPSDHYALVIDVALVAKECAELPRTTPLHEWVEVRRGEPLPEGACFAGCTSTDGGTYVGRSMTLECGKLTLSPGERKVGSIWSHHDGRSTRGDCLVFKPDAQCIWVPVKRGERLPKAAVPAGYTRMDGETYVARTVRSCGKQHECGKLNLSLDGAIWNIWTHRNGSSQSGEVLITVDLSSARSQDDNIVSERRFSGMANPGGKSS